jgi:diguanylate cyclase (GGDEF)-like protein
LIESARASGRRSVVCYLDLDRFKTVNDECGHMAGDALLCELAAAIRRIVPESGSVARLGGDEIGILLSNCPIERATQIADEVVRTVANQRFTWEDRSFGLTASVGLVEFSSESGSLVDVMCTAETFCDLAKQQGGGRVCDQSASDAAAARRRAEIRWLKRLQSALEGNGFELHLEPTVAAAGDLASSPGLEVVLLLKDENGATIAPDEFTPTAERFGLMPHVDRWVVQTAFAALSRGAVQLPAEGRLTIRLSPQSLGDAAFLDFMVDSFDRTGVTPDRICFEVPDEPVMSNLEHARRFMGVLQTMGCRFGIDDVGRGVG